MRTAGMCANYGRCSRFEYVVVGAAEGDTCSECGQCLLHASGLTWADARGKGYESAGLDYTHPLHAASLYVEELKYGEGDRVVEGVGLTQIVGQMEGLLRDAGIEGVDAAILVSDCDHYGNSFAASLGLPPIIGKSIFVDGLMHGLAIAGKLSGRVAEETHS